MSKHDRYSDSIETDGGFNRLLRDMERQTYEELGDDEALAALDARDSEHEAIEEAVAKEDDS